MPELPEVETVRRGLNSLIVGKTIKSVSHGSDKSFPNDQSSVDQFLIGASVKAVNRRAKVLLIELSSDYTVMVHLKMTGQLVFVKRKPGTSKNEREERFGAGHPNESLVGILPDKSTRVSLEFTDGSHVYFNDQRRFGWVKLLPTVLVMEDAFMKKVGPEPLESSFTTAVFIERVRRRKGTSIKAAILDQTVLAGIGNIYADEGLWGAGIYPATVVKHLTDKQLIKLHAELLFVLRLAIKKGGSTNKNYVNAEGKRGSYMDFARVFRREGLPCPRCKTIIEKSKVAGRGTHTCPACQPKRRS